MLYLLGKQTYKLKLPKQWRINDVFHVSLPELDTSRKGQVGKKVTKLEFEAGNSKEYKIEAIWDSIVYANEAKS